jgi:hypothetical protein
MNEPVKLITTKPDIELAKELKDELTNASEAWLKACTKAHALGFEVAANFAPNYLGQYVIQQLALLKRF